MFNHTYYMYSVTTNAEDVHVHVYYSRLIILMYSVLVVYNHNYCMNSVLVVYLTCFCIKKV